MGRKREKSLDANEETQEVDTIAEWSGPAKEEEEQPIDKKSRPKKGNAQEVREAAADDETDRATTPGEQSGPDNVKRSRGRPKKSPDQRQESKGALVKWIPSLPPVNERPVDDTVGATQELDTTAKESRSRRANEEAEQAVDDTRKPKKGRPKSFEGDKKELGDVGAATADEIERTPDKVKRSRGGPQKSRDGRRESDSALATQTPLPPPKDERLVDVAVEDTQELDTTAEERRSGPVKEEEQPFDDTIKRKRGRSKKSEGDEQAPGEVAVAVAGEQSNPGKVKRSSGRPKKSENDQQESEAALVKQTHSIPPEDEQPGNDTVGVAQELDTTVEERRSSRAKEEEQPVDDTIKRKRGRPKQSEADEQALGEVAAAGSGEQSNPDKVKRSRGTPKKSENHQQESETALVKQTHSFPPEDEQPGNDTVGVAQELDITVERRSNQATEEEQPIDDTISRKRRRPKKLEGDEQARGVVAAAAVAGEQSIPDKVELSRGRPKKSENDQQESEAALVKQTHSLPLEDEQPVNDTAGELHTTAKEGEQPVDDTTKRKKGRPKKSPDDHKESEGALVKESPSFPPENEQPVDDTANHRKETTGKKSESAGQELAATADDDDIQRAVELAAISQPKPKRGRAKKTQSEEQVTTRQITQPLPGDQQPIKDNEQKRKRGKLGEKELEPAEGRQPTPSPPVEDCNAAKLNLRKGRSNKSGDHEQDLDEATIGKQSTTQSTGEQHSEDKHNRKRGRPEEPKMADKELEAAEERRKQSTAPDGEQVTEEKHKQKKGRLGKSKEIEKALEVAEGAASAPSSGEEPVDEIPKRKLDRPKKPKNGSEETKSEEKHGAANGGQQVSGKRESGRARAGRKAEKPAASKSTSTTTGQKKEGAKTSAPAPKMARKHHLPKIEVDGIEFHVGDDVYVKKSDGDSSESDTEVEDCRICGITNEETMLECDDCLAGFHLTCLSPPLENIPEGDWICPYCEKGEAPTEPASSQHRHRSARERLLARDLWAARIERIWREPDGKSCFSAHWFLVPEETALGRQPHNGKRELFRSNRSDDNEMDSILRHCYVMSPKDYKNSTGEGDDVFFCEYEYNEQWCKFKRIEYLDDNENWSEDDQPFDPSDESEEEGNAGESDGRKRRRSIQGKRLQPSKSIKAANIRHNYSRGIEEVGAKTIPNGVRKRPQTDFDRAKAALALSAVPPSLPCRDRERKEISSFLRDSVGAGEHCLGRCLYISGVPGTGKTATVLEVIKELSSKVESGELPPYRFVEINGLRLPSPDHAYTILHEALTGQHVGWKRALQYLDERFSKAEPGKGVDARPTVLLVDELDLLVTRNQSVLYNIFDWPTRPQSRLVIIGIANTMDLPERMLPRIASRMGMHRISFSPYSHKQLEEIISARLKEVQVFDKQATEFASRKVAAVSGDIRRALELCRRAVEVAEARLKLQSASVPAPGSNGSLSNGVTAVTQANQGPQGNSGSIILADVDAAISEMFEAPQIQMMKRSAKLAKIFLVAIVYEQRRTSMAETTFEKIATTCSELCTSNGEERPDWDTLLAVGCKLGASRLLLCEPGAQHRLQKLQLNFPCDDVSFALKKDEESPWLGKYL